MRQAIQFLTILPCPAPDRPLGRGAWAFPLVGAALGLGAAGLWALPMGPLGIVILLAILTGGLHEDGLADVCDAVRGYRSREKMLAILKDSRIGAHGALALVASFVWRWQGLVLVQGDVGRVLPAVFGISRAMMVLLAASAPGVGSGLGKAFGDSLPRGAVFLVALQMGALAVLAGRSGVALVAVNLLVLVVMRGWFLRRLGGVTGDCLGAVCQVSEAASLGVLAWSM